MCYTIIDYDNLTGPAIDVLILHLIWTLAKQEFPQFNQIIACLRIASRQVAIQSFLWPLTAYLNECETTMGQAAPEM